MYENQLSFITILFYILRRQKLHRVVLRYVWKNFFFLQKKPYVSAYNA